MITKKKTGGVFIYLLGICLLYGCGTSQPFYKSQAEFQKKSSKNKEIAYSLFLIGDTGAPQLEGAQQVLRTLQYQLKRSGDSSSVVFLGDNIYPDGMPVPDHDTRTVSENRLKPSLEILRDYGGTSFFIPGNHDWMHGQKGIREQEQFIENYTGINAQFTPDKGCPGPTSFSLNETWQLITLDSEWWMSQKLKTGSQLEGCKNKSRTEVMQQVADLVDKYDDKEVVIAFHHSLYSNGVHGGYYSLKDHIFPLTNLNDYAYVPLPVIGSLYPVIRQVGKFPQDQLHVGYQEFKRELLEATEDKEHVFFASGHEHSLSFYKEDKANTAKEGQDFFILSGSGSKKSYARKGYGAEFVYAHKGFAKLNSYTDGSVAIEFWTAEEGNRGGRLVYRKQLLEPDAVGAALQKGSSEVEEVRSDSVTIAAGPQYKAGGFKRFIWGDHYRAAWTQKVDAPVLDLETEKGGLNIIAKTGGVQTVTLIAEDPEGRKYVLRSVQKDPTKSLPEPLQKTLAADIAKDQTSATHPYGGEIAALLAPSAGVYHTTPELRYISSDSNIGLDFGNRAGTLVMMEEFVSKEWFNKKYGKKSVEIVDTDELWEQLRRGSNATIDERQLVRSRLFDIYIGDWDRHEKQWFWAQTPTDTSAVYEPIPIDRDNAFYRSDGVMLGLARRFLMPKFQNFGDDVDNIKGINLNAQHFDRWFINQLSRAEWVAIAKEMQASITDSAITAAVQRWPQSIRQLNGDEFISKLKARRAKLPDFARRYYDLLMREVNVYGSDNSEEYIVQHAPNGKTSVAMYHVGNEGEKQLRYSRTVKAEETNEIRLYGFGGNDRFNIEGKADETIKVRIIGGDGEDTIAGQSTGAKTLVYDTWEGSKIEANTKVTDKRSAKPWINRYEKRGFQYDFTGPLISTGYNETDGPFIGGGIILKRQAFRKHPFSARHRIRAKSATQTTAFSISYDGILTEKAGDYDIEVETEIVYPNRSVKYFGLGNGTRNENPDSDFYSYRMDNVDVEAGLAQTFANLLTVRTRLGMEYNNPVAVDNRFITSPEAGLSDKAFGAHYHGTLSGEVVIEAIDEAINPSYGSRFNTLTELKVGLNGKSSTFGRIGSDLTLYYTFRGLRTTLVSRTGFNTIIGDYSFFQANSLGGSEFSGSSGNLRGFLRNRFAGRPTAFQNTELRTKLFNITSYILPGSLGAKAFLDTGRAWAENSQSPRWHIGYGGGLWFSPLDSFVLTGGLAFSTEETLLTLSLGFPF